MSEDHGPWGHLYRKIHQLVSIRMGGKIEALQPAPAREFAGAVAEMKRLAPTGRAEGASGCVRRGIADKQNGMTFFGHHVLREVMRGGVLAKHAGGDHEELAIHFQFAKIALLQHLQIQRLMEIEIRPSIGRARRDQVIDFGKHSSQATDIYRLPV